MKHITTLFAILFLSTLTGCSDGKLKTEPVRGVVTLDGKPLAEAAVSFVPKNDGEGAPGFGRTNEKGEYILQTMAGNPNAGTLPGEYIVTISKYKSVPTGRKIMDTSTRELVNEVESVMLFPRMKKVYASIGETPFSARVVKGRNRFDFGLRSEE